MRPVIAGLCSYESIVNSILSVADLAALNDLLDVREVNTRRLRAHFQPDHSDMVIAPRA